jgi:hypothetical protein
MVCSVLLVEGIGFLSATRLSDEDTAVIEIPFVEDMDKFVGQGAL